MKTSDWIQLAGVLVTLVGAFVTTIGVGAAVVALAIQMRTFNRQMKVQIYSDYTKRYQEIILRFPEDVNDPDFVMAGRPDYDATMRQMRAYFDLCYEEWHLHEQRLIGDDIWEVWRSGMVLAFSKPAFTQAWWIIMEHSDYGSAFEAFVARAVGPRAAVAPPRHGP